MARATLIVEVDDPLAVAAAKSWLEQNKDKLDHVSENDGCGCCVDIWYVEGPLQVLQTAPEGILGTSEWDSPDSA